MSIVTRILALAGLLALLVPGAASAERRVALLIGNSSYEAVSQLTNPARDVAAIKAALEGAGFEKVDIALDLGHDKLIRALRDFEDDAQHADIALVYYSGHGMEMNGENYLLPVDAHLARDRDVEDEAVSLDRVLRSLDGVKRLRLVILDACRNNPFATKMVRSKGTRAVDRGLARVEPANTDTLIAFAAKAGTVASDGDDANSPFTASLVKRLVEPGTDIRLALGNVRDDVLAATNHQQEPITYGSLGGGKIMLAMDTTSAPPVVTDQGAKASDLKQPLFGQPQFNPCGDAAAHWAEAQKFDRLELYQRHLTLFGQCAFADFARLRIEEKTKLAALPPAVTTGDQTPAGGATLCDQLAADPTDPDKIGPGVPWAKLDGPRAVAACRNALQADPRNGRFALELGRALEKTQDTLSAAAAYRQGGENGNAAAFLALAYLYENGNGVARDDTKAVGLLHQAADKGSIDALTELGFLVASGRGAAKDDAAAAGFYQQAADKGSALAMNNLAYMYETGRGVTKDVGHAISLYRKAADGGSALAASNLGGLYRDGKGVPRDMGEAVRYLKKAVDLGENTGMYKLGLLYRDGNGVLQDKVEAVRLFQLAADRGNAEATTELGYDTETGIGGLRPDAQEAARLYKKAADMGSALAMNNLGYFYQVGKGVDKNPQEAIRLYKKAIDAGNSLAATNLGFLYKDGLGVPRNDNEALRVFTQAAEMNNTDAMYQLGLFATLGRGGPKDSATAATWLVKSIAGGNAFSLKEMSTNAGAWGAPFRSAVQAELKQRGVYNGPINGTFGASTIAALKQLAGG
jgi:TPR repeat protein